MDFDMKSRAFALKREFISFDKRQKKRNQRKTLSRQSKPIVLLLRVISRLAIHGSAGNGVHPCTPPYGSCGILDVQTSLAAKSNRQGNNLLRDGAIPCVQWSLDLASEDLKSTLALGDP